MPKKTDNEKPTILNGNKNDTDQNNKTNSSANKKSRKKVGEDVEPILPISEAEPKTHTNSNEKSPLQNKPRQRRPEVSKKKQVSKIEPVSKEEPVLDVLPDNKSDLKEDPVIEIKPKNKRRTSSQRSLSKVNYDSTDFVSVQAMESLKGFAPLGMLFVLMDVLNTQEEGVIRVNRLASALSIGKPAMLAQLENLEQAGLIRTVSSSQRGRHIELLIPNLVTLQKEREILPAEPAFLVPSTLPEGVPKNFSLERLKALQNYLEEREIRVVHLPDELGLDSRFAGIAAFLGKYLPYVQPFYSRLKTTLNEGEEVQFSLLGFQGRDVTHTLNFCKMLQDADLLSTFTYRRAPHCTIVARINRTSAAINFLSGGWLEHYIRDRVTAILTTHPSTMDMPFAFMKNPRILLPGNEDFEFDFLMMVGDKVFWIEAKTGEYLEYIGKYSRVSKLLGLSRNSNLLVLVDVPPPESNLSARYGISCCGVTEFAEVFRLALIRELGRQSRKK